MLLGAGRVKPHNESSRHKRFERAFILLLLGECLPGDKLQKLQPTLHLSLVFALCRNLSLVYIFVKLRVEAARRSRVPLRRCCNKHRNMTSDTHLNTQGPLGARCVNDTRDWYLQKDRPVMSRQTPLKTSFTTAIMHILKLEAILYS